MAKSIKLDSPYYWDSSSVVYNNETLDTILENISQNFDNIKIDTIFSRNKGVFNAQRVNFDASKYNLFLVEYNLYSGTDYFSTILITTYRSYYELSTPFFSAINIISEGEILYWTVGAFIFMTLQMIYLA